MQGETRLKSQILTYLKKIPRSWWYKSNDRFTAGLPDIMGVIAGKFIAIELKMPNGKVTKLQKYTIEKITQAGGKARVCYSLTEVKSFLKEVENYGNKRTGTDSPVQRR